MLGAQETRTASLSDVGRVREMNQDVCGEFSNEDYRFLVVADGMGGHSGGETASRMALETLGAAFEAGFDDPETMLRDGFAAANDQIHQAGAEDTALNGMGTTGVALLLGPNGTGWVAHVGDSRAYQMRGNQFKQITEDHSWIYQEVRNKRVSPEEAATHPMKNVLLRSIGVAAHVDVTISSLDVRPGDRFLLCSDGLWGEVDGEPISEILETEEPEDAVRMLVDLANDCGGSDNVTVQVAVVPGIPSDTTLETQPQADSLADTFEQPALPKTMEMPANGGTAATDGSTTTSWMRPVAALAGIVIILAVFWRAGCA